MELNKKKFALAAAGTMGIAYVVCIVAVAVAPELALKLLGWVAHIVNTEKFAGDVELTLGGAALGLIQVLVYAYAVGWIFAWMHNRLKVHG